MLNVILFLVLLAWLKTLPEGREYELMTVAHAKLYVCLGGGETAGGRGVVSSSRGWGRQTVHKPGAV
jgi:hypothetical protein